MTRSLIAAFFAQPRALARLLRVRLSPRRRATPVPPSDAAVAVAVADTRLQRARLAVALGVVHAPHGPGLWLRTTRDGRQRLYRVRDHNGELYAVAGGTTSTAVPTSQLSGHWQAIGQSVDSEVGRPREKSAPNRRAVTPFG